MRLIPLTEYSEETMQLAKPIYDSHRRVLLAARNKIHSRLQERLKQMGIGYIIVEDAVSEGVSLDEMLDMPTWLDIIQLVKLSYEAAAAKKLLPLRELLQGVDKLLKEVTGRAVVVSVPATAVVEDLRLYAHAVNVALVALQSAKKLGYNDLQMRDIALGCLLHDIGKVLTTDEKLHPEAGFQYLRTIREVNLLSAHIAFQHHEKVDGTGYPRAISGTDVHDYAQLCGLADRYDNLLTIQQVFPHEAVEAVMALNGTAYKESIVQAFIHGVAPYPPGTKVMLNN